MKPEAKGFPRKWREKKSRGQTATAYGQHRFDSLSLDGSGLGTVENGGRDLNGLEDIYQGKWKKKVGLL